MAKERKMTCECGHVLVKKNATFDEFETEAMVCPGCQFTTLTKEQAKNYVRLKQLHQIIDSKRKIIKIGNSMGLTLPDRLKDLGVKVGRKIKTEALTPNSFKVELE
ncbi:hypothetical protein CMO92_01515 [Candidatus Woesearchaeota archaeon]|nr:hypothetical protein [Candidatus Woesearchaeota archaeon]|tara:strand:+ start:1508 stop:1825 length:318 start_codon:yes stop_codon:yes gene_type:complete